MSWSGQAATWLATAPLPMPSTSPSSFDWLGPIAGTGLVGVFLLMVLLRFKIMPTYVHDDARKEWERERLETKTTLEEARRALADGNKVYTEQVIPTLTRALDAERELLDLRREEQRRQEARGRAWSERSEDGGHYVERGTRDAP